jgi:hypothetical protein
MSEKVPKVGEVWRYNFSDASYNTYKLTKFNTVTNRFDTEMVATNNQWNLPLIELDYLHISTFNTDALILELLYSTPLYKAIKGLE